MLIYGRQVHVSQELVARALEMVHVRSVAAQELQNLTFVLIGAQVHDIVIIILLNL